MWIFSYFDRPDKFFVCITNKWLLLLRYHYHHGWTAMLEFALDGRASVSCDELLDFHFARMFVAVMPIFFSVSSNLIHMNSCRQSLTRVQIWTLSTQSHVSGRILCWAGAERLSENRSGWLSCHSAVLLGKQQTGSGQKWRFWTKVAHSRNFTLSQYQHLQ